MNYHAALAHFPKITYRRYRLLAAYFNHLSELWQAKFPDLIHAGLEENVAHEFLVWRHDHPLQEIAHNLQKLNIKTASLSEPDYPGLLKEIADPPHTLFYRGILPNPGDYLLSVVGTRKFTTYGKEACERLVSELVAAGIKIVSGLALGIDGIAHQTTLDNGGITFAVLGSGLDRGSIYPREHVSLVEKIIDNCGAVISEYPPGFGATKYSFPARNRIVAGLSTGPLLIEAPERSGALITARLSLDYNREVMAIPHSLTSPTGQGNNNLLKLGARVILNSNDILETMQINYQKL